MGATLSFTPGNYATLCFIEDPATGPEHTDLGMVQPFTVPWRQAPGGGRSDGDSVTPLPDCLLPHSAPKLSL